MGREGNAQGRREITIRACKEGKVVHFVHKEREKEKERKGRVAKAQKYQDKRFLPVFSVFLPSCRVFTSGISVTQYFNFSILPFFLCSILIFSPRVGFHNLPFLPYSLLSGIIT